MKPTKRSQRDLQELEDLVPKQARIDETGWTGVNERTFIAVKPDGVQRKLVGEIVCRFEKRGFKLVALKLVKVFTSGSNAWNVIHGSDSVESAQKEICLWFRQSELHRWESSSKNWIY
ncbi:hypothetical protein XENOCAPTIV_000262 [Xenoophorus captivus]|uniref:Nucleoside diphosphate kinase n=1 Tax=Xenoophorus captivus TaxID=1517983 RepID=A0ABV0QP07_9TELE